MHFVFLYITITFCIFILYVFILFVYFIKIMLFLILNSCHNGKNNNQLSIKHFCVFESSEK